MPNKNYRSTLNLPRADGFPMKAGLIQKEPAIQKEWEKTNLFSAVREKSKGRKTFVLHDGPPYANGSIHMGHLLNKILKDITVRSKTMGGYDCFLKPGWDCHGLPIEHKTLMESEDITGGSDPVLIRKKCRNYADKYVRKQTAEMKRLGTIADYENPYLTMKPEYEAGVLEVFAEIVSKNIVKHDLKPVHWSIENKTALAEAELEYGEKTDPSIYVLFPVTGTERLPASLNLPKDEEVSLMIWTTTPWTLPANLAVAVSPEAQYGLYTISRPAEINCIVAEDIAETVFAKPSSVLTAKKLGSCAGRDLLSAQTAYRHPFVKREGRVFCAPFVGTGEGTGIVHIAPGHGADDYAVGIQEGLDIYSPVLEDGTYDSSVPNWLKGMNIWDANKVIIEKLGKLGLLFHKEEITHSYPHDWRGKSPTIMRATPQWFIKMDEPMGGGNGKTLREMALEAVKKIKFHPEWGRKRLKGMLESRPDWCISRQRSWGLPIPAFTNADGDILMTRMTVLSVAEKIRTKGSNLWFEAKPAELLEGYDPARDCDAPAWAKDGWDPNGLKKGADIFDVWFESGSSWHSVLGKPADLYLEGSDQHRGWFQSSLIQSLGANGKPPFKQVLTHGFIVDAQGKKMSKSGGNALEVGEVLKRYGADICRWWVSSLNYSNDIKADMKIMEAAADEYRTVRNTIRFLLSNLYDFDPEKDWVPLDDDYHSMNTVALIMLRKYTALILNAYSEFEYREASRQIIGFCESFLSRHYIVTVRDRLYCDRPDSKRRRKAQAVIYRIVDALIKLCAPILVHTAEEAYRCLLGEKWKSVHLEGFFPLRWGHLGEKWKSVHLEGLQTRLGWKNTALSGEQKIILETLYLKSSSFDEVEFLFSKQKEKDVLNDWFPVLAEKERWLAQLEVVKNEAQLSNPLDTEVPMEEERLKQFDKEEIADFIGVSRIQVKTGGNSGVEIKDLRNSPKCDRCWKRDETASERSDGGILCDRCADAVGL